MKKDKAIKRLLSNGWAQLVPGVFVAKEVPDVSSEEAEVTKANVDKWEARYEELEENSFLVYLKNEFEDSPGTTFESAFESYDDESLEPRENFVATGEFKVLSSEDLKK